MQYATLLALAAAFLGVEAKIAFSHTPGSSVTAGEPFSLEWDGADEGSPVTITLKKGDPNDLQTVALLTGNGKDGHYIWTPSKSLENADNYALEISQGVDETNYSGEFSLEGAKAAASSGAAASSSSSSSSGAKGVTTVIITSGTTSYTTTESGGGSSGTGAAKTTRSSNSTISSATPTGGINVSSSSTPTPTTASSSSSSGVAAAVGGPIGGLAAVLLGAVALL